MCIINAISHTVTVMKIQNICDIYDYSAKISAGHNFVTTPYLF